jgi:hypothetical protein
MEKSVKYFLMPVIAALTLSTAAIAQRGCRGDNRRYYSSRNSYRSSIFVQPRYMSRYNTYPRFNSIPRSSISIVFGGNPYYYHGGGYYRPYNGFYRRVMPPIGLQIGILPVGYIPIIVGRNEYYFSEGIYYRRANDKNYEVVDAPMGAQISSLPSGAKSVVVNGEKFYELNGTYYKKDNNYKGEQVYTVVGKNGEIDNTDEVPAQSAQAIGDKVAQLPANTKTITLNGEKLYVGADDTYYRVESDGTYTIVGLPNSSNL